MKFYPWKEELVERLNLKEVGSDESGWRVFYANGQSNFIKVFPFSEHHGGGIPYLLEMEIENFESYLKQNPNIEKEL